MKTMTIDELLRKGLKEGDVAYFTSLNDWGIVTGERSCQCLKASPPYSASCWFTTSAMIKNVTKVIFKEDWIKENPIKIMELLQGHNNHILFPITQVIKKKMAKYIHAVHFGSSNIYTWRVPKEFEYIDFRVGDIVEVDTVKGRQYVEIRETAEYEYDERTKEITMLVKVYDYRTRRRFK